MKAPRQFLWLSAWFLAAAPLTHAAVFEDFEYEIDGDNVIITKYTGNDGEVTIPSFIDGKAVTTIDTAFISNTSLTGVNIPDSVTTLEAAFMGCSNLTNVTIPESVSTIGRFSFSSCESLTSIIIPDSVTEIGSQAFYNCQSLNSIEIGLGVTAIRGGAFRECTGLTHVKIPDNVISIADGVFYLCSNLATVSMGAGVATIGPSAFRSCPNLYGVYFSGDKPDAGKFIFADSYNVTVYYLAGTNGWDETFADRPTALWELPVNLQIINPAEQDGIFSFTIIGAADQSVTVEACTELGKDSWTLIGTCTLTEGSFDFRDTESPNSPRRFYRATVVVD